MFLEYLSVAQVEKFFKDRGIYVNDISVLAPHRQLKEGGFGYGVDNDTRKGEIPNYQDEAVFCNVLDLYVKISCTMRAQGYGFIEKEWTDFVYSELPQEKKEEYKKQLQAYNEKKAAEKAEKEKNQESEDKTK